MGELVIFGLAGLSIIACIVAFIKTPNSQRYRLTTPQIPIEERLAACPKSAESVIIKADKKCFALKVYLPMFAIFGILLFFNYLAKNYFPSGTECSVEFRGAISIIVVFYVFPIIFLVCSVFIVSRGFKILKTGYYPLLDSVVFKDTIAKKGKGSIFQAIFHLLFPLYVAYLFYLLHDLYGLFNMSTVLQQVLTKLNSMCFD